MSEKCSQSVYDRSMRFPRAFPCKRKATIEEGGKWWCSQHAPSLVTKRREEKHRQWEREWDAAEARREREKALQSARAAVIEAAKAWYVLDSQRDDDALTKAVQDLIRIEGEKTT